MRLGEWDVNSDAEFYANREYEVESITIHPQYHPGQEYNISATIPVFQSNPLTSSLLSPGNLYNDLALVKLQEKIEIEKFDHIGTICLPHHAQVG